MQKVTSVEQSPVTKIYFIVLECGHSVLRKRFFKDVGSELRCDECRSGKRADRRTGS